MAEGRLSIGGGDELVDMALWVVSVAGFSSRPKLAWIMDGMSNSDLPYYHRICG